MTAAHVFVHPSRTSADGNREGVPNSMLEAMQPAYLSSLRITAEFPKPSRTA